MYSKLATKNEILKQIKAAVVEVDPSAQVILFGSQARGDAHEESDWDVLVLTGKEVVDVSYKRTLLRRLMEVQLKYGITVSSLIRNKKDWDDLALTWLYQEVKKDGKQIA